MWAERLHQGCSGQDRSGTAWIRADKPLHEAVSQQDEVGAMHYPQALQPRFLTALIRQMSHRLPAGADP